MTLANQKRLFFLGYSISRISDETLVFLIPLLSYATTGDISKSGFLLAAEWIPRLITLFFVGTGVDKYGSRAMTISADIVRFTLLLCSSFFILIYHSELNFLWLTLISVLIGIAAEISYVSTEVLIVQVFRENLEASQKLTQSIDQLVHVLAPALAVWIYARLGMFYIFGCLTLMVSLNLMILYSCVPISLFKLTENVRMSTTFGILAILKNRCLRFLCGMAFGANLALGAVLSTMPHFILGKFGFTESMASYVTVASALTSVLVMSRLRGSIVTDKKAIGASIILIPAFIGINFSPLFVIYGASYVTLVVAASILTLYVRLIRTKLCSNQELGRVTGAMVLINSASYPISGLLIYMFGQQYLNEVWIFITLFLWLQIFLFVNSVISNNGMRMERVYQ
jgi:MFS family permease